MSTFALSLVLIAAVLHATWNAMVKGAGDRDLTLGIIIAGHAVAGLALVLAFPPPARESWPFIATSVLTHWFYYFFLNLAYRHGEKLHRFFINGQTGKVHGRKPWSGKRIAAAIGVGVAVLLAIILTLLALGVFASHG